MHTLILLFPFLSFILSGVFGRFLGSFYVGIISVYLLFYTFELSLLYLLREILFPNLELINYGNWFHVLGFVVDWEFLFDSTSIIMLIIVSFISFLVHLYSLGYLDEDPSINRFLSFLSLFTFFMLFFVLSSNLVQMFIGWEGVGLVSYLLINFWYHRYQANRAALKAIVINRIGDFFFLFAIILIWYFFGDCNFIYLKEIAPIVNNEYFTYFQFNFHKISTISLFLFLAAIVKSAQFGFHTWLPDAMEGPTPVSALLHAATMVTAGVFLVIRTSFFFEYSPSITTIMLILGAFTTFFASFTAFFQYDIKKIIAYSTCAQLGLMFVACALDNYILALFHLFNHAFFKALLFLSAGIIIHGTNDEQDIRKFGGLYFKFPITFLSFLIGSLSLMGFPFLTGFYSKDPIFELLLVSLKSHSNLALYFSLLGTAFTAAYSTRLLHLVFFSTYRGSKTQWSHIHETTRPELLTPIFLLIIASSIIGYLFYPVFLDVDSTFWKNSLNEAFINSDYIYAEFLPFYCKLLPLIITFLGILFYFYYSLFLYKNFFSLIVTLLIKTQNTNVNTQYILSFFQTVQRAFHIDSLYYTFILKPIFFISYNILYINIEKGLFEYFGPTGITLFFKYIAHSLSKIKTKTLTISLFIALLAFIYLFLI